MTSSEQSARDMERLAELVEEWHEHADYLYDHDDRRMQGMASGYRSCAEELAKVVE